MTVSRSISILITNISFLFALGFCSDIRGQEDVSYNERTKFERPLVKKVLFNGVKSFDRNEINKLLYTKPNHWYNLFGKRELSRSNVRYDTGIIKRYYNRRGFLFTIAMDSTIVDDNRNATVTFFVDEGIQTYLSGIEISGGLAEINGKFNKTLEQFKTGEPVNESKVLAGRFTLRDIYHDSGYPFAKVDSRYEFDEDSVNAFVHYVVSESLLTYNGQTSLTKEGYTNTNVIMRELVNDPSMIYSKKKMIESERRLLSTGLFKYLSLMRDDNSVKLENDTCSVDFVLNYEERKRNQANLGLGIGQEEDFEVVFKVSGRWGIRNINGTGRQMYIKPRLLLQVTDPQGSVKNLNISDFIRKKLSFRFIKIPIEINYIEPWFLSRRLPLTVKLTWEPKTLNKRIRDFEYRYDRIAGEIVIINELDRFTTARLSVATEYLNIIDVPPDQQEAYRAEGDNQIRRKISLYGERDTRDNFFVPQHGSYSFIGMDYVGGVLGGDFGYFKAQFSWSRYQILIGENILATRFWLGWLDDMGENGRSSAEDRFMLGGATTIRGYTENSLGPVFTEADDPGGDKVGKPKGGRYIGLGNIELRRSLFWRFGGSVFLDAGNTYSNFNHITPLSVAFSSGLGMQFFTPIGPIRIDYAVRLKKELDLGEGNLHLSILYAF
ncbi:MAG: BamA/TamA family outer membrane protein [candidate division Zixibacteria bacterium]